MLVVRERTPAMPRREAQDTSREHRDPRLIFRTPNMWCVGTSWHNQVLTNLWCRPPLAGRAHDAACGRIRCGPHQTVPPDSALATVELRRSLANTEARDGVVDARHADTCATG